MLLLPPYAPDLAPWDFYIFCSLQNNLNGKKVASAKEVKNYLTTLFENKPPSFFQEEIQKLKSKKLGDSYRK